VLNVESPRERLPLPNVVDFLLQRERVERRERKTEKKADAPVEHGESLTKSMLDLFWRSLDGGGVGDTPMRLGELFLGLAPEVLSAQTRVLDLA
jgi:hypothetical protein